MAKRRGALQGHCHAPVVTICALLFGDYFDLARRLLESIQKKCPKTAFRLVVGANAVGRSTLDYVSQLHRQGLIDRLIVSQTNLNKCPMMRRMFSVIDTEFVWWFDDDSFLTDDGATSKWLGHARSAPASTVMWGQLGVCRFPSDFTHLEDAAGFVRQAKWYRGLPPPSWRLGGKGEFDFEGEGTGDGRWFFLLGGCWLIRTSAIRALGWPDRRLVKMGDDVFLGEAIRQQGWALGNIGSPGVIINGAKRRGDSG